MNTLGLSHKDIDLLDKLLSSPHYVHLGGCHYQTLPHDCPFMVEKPDGTKLECICPCHNP